MVENINKLLDRGEQLDTMVDKTSKVRGHRSPVASDMTQSYFVKRVPLCSSSLPARSGSSMNLGICGDLFGFRAYANTCFSAFAS